MRWNDRASELRVACFALCLLACSSAQDHEPDASAAGLGGGGAVSGGGGGSGSGGASGGSGGSGGAGGGGSGGQGGTSGMDQVGGASGTSAGTSADRVCPGVEEPAWLAGRPRCTTTMDCEATGTLGQCLLEPISFACGGAAPMQECMQDLDCGPQRTCLFDDCGGSLCLPECDAATCTGSNKCELGRCIPKRCDEPEALPCPMDYVCDASTEDDVTRGCTAVQCVSGYECPAGRDCVSTQTSGADAHGCMQRPCSIATDCDCGECVDGGCEPYAGVCMSIVGPP